MFIPGLSVQIGISPLRILDLMNLLMMVLQNNISRVFPKSDPNFYLLITLV